MVKEGGCRLPIESGRTKWVMSPTLVVRVVLSGSDRASSRLNHRPTGPEVQGATVTDND